MKITINLDPEELKILRKRAKKNLLSLREQIEDIIRRSCVRKTGSTPRKINVDDRLVHVFSRERRGNWRKKKKKSVKKKK